MILVAESGSTKTDWILINNKSILTNFKTNGFNPYFTNSNEITTELKLKAPENLPVNDIKNIYFYGAGCSSSKMNQIIFDGLKQFFNSSEIEVNHDLLAAARALFKNKEGIAVILGTGSNTCLYDGKNIVKNITSLGFILGDEGGGDYLGKLFITSFLNDELPKEIHNKFFNRFNLTKNQILHAVYKEPYPNKFLASFCEFILEISSNEFVSKLIQKSFTDLFIKHLCKYNDYKNYNIRFTGSIAHYYQDFLKKTASDFSLEIDLIEKNPINRLVEFHIENN